MVSESLFPPIPKTRAHHHHHHPHHHHHHHNHRRLLRLNVAYSFLLTHIHSPEPEGPPPSSTVLSLKSITRVWHLLASWPNEADGVRHESAAPFVSTIKPSIQPLSMNSAEPGRPTAPAPSVVDTGQGFWLHGYGRYWVQNPSGHSLLVAVHSCEWQWGVDLPDETYWVQFTTVLQSNLQSLKVGLKWRYSIVSIVGAVCRTPR